MAKRTTSSSFFSIFKYADKYDVLLMILGFVGSVGDGASIPSMMLIMSSLVNVFGDESQNNLSSSASFLSEINRLSLDFVYIGLAVGLACFFEASSWIKTGERQAARLRSLYLKAILRQDETFFDIQGSNTAEVIESVAADSHTIQEVISEKVPHFLMNVSMFVTSNIVGFILAWRLAVVSLAFLPLLIIPGLLYGRILTGLAVKMKTEYLKAGTVAEQALSSVRTVYSFVGEERTLNKYSAFLDSTVKLGLKQGIAKGLAIGSNGIVFAIWAFNAWYGNKLVTEYGVNGGKIVATGLSGIIGGLALGSSLPNIKYFSEAAVAGGRIIEMISRVPEIDHYDENGKILDHVNGELELRSVRFAYPARPDSVVFDGFSLVIPAGKTTALVGSSGSGKSTVIALLQRFYDPQDGEVLMDGVNLKQLKLRWLRDQMGLVSQEPAMFATTVKQNILFGKEDATADEIIEAAKKSNAHNFISQLPDGYDTQVGERGVQLSGGQKQRIAIARAIIRNPKVLLLDEATSALDAESERVVQEALDMASLGRTTVVVAHRLSTVRHADAIAVVQNGRVLEIGRHHDLMEKQESAYAALVLTSTAVKPVTETTGEDIRKRTSSLARRTSSALSRDSGSFRSLQEDAATKDDGNPQLPSLGRLVGMNLPEWRNAVLGTFGASVFGVIQPLYAFCLGGTVMAFFLTDREHQRRLIRNYSFGFLALAVASFLSNAVQHYNFAAMGEHLTKRVRQTMLANVLTFEIGWFDASESNSSGAVAGRLASDANSVRALVGDRWSLLVTTAVAIVAASTFGLVLAWQLALVILAGQPFIILCFYLRKVLIKSMSEKALTMQKQSNQLAAESVTNHRTVAAFCSQPLMLQIFEASQAEPRRTSTRQAIIGGCGLSSAQFVMFCAWALDFWFAGKLVSWGDITAEAMFKTFFILVSTGRVIADAGSMTSDIAKGAAAVASVFAILDRKTLICPDDGQKVEKIEGEVELRHVEFAYPQRPDVLVFRDFNLRIPTGKSVALVGKSGSGKSTVISLIERFYDPSKGRVLIDGKDIRKLQLRSLRRHMSLVGQEPTLFAGTVKENILYGKDDASEDEIVEAAKAANAHDFICALANGYDTNVGERGVQISGGQKQRIAIARAILKNPAILLLDEATSALDTQSEKVVQEALDRIMVHRTTIVVAHRLSTIQNCDSISVVQEGAIVEKGKHGDLMARGDSGVYYNLVKLQHQHLTMNY